MFVSFLGIGRGGTHVLCFIVNPSINCVSGHGSVCFSFRAKDLVSIPNTDQNICFDAYHSIRLFCDRLLSYYYATKCALIETKKLNKTVKML